MKAKILSIILLSPLIALASPYMASKKTNHDLYLKLEGGASIPKKSGELRYQPDNFITGLGGGYKYSEFFRGDLVLQYREIRTKDFSLDTNTKKLNIKTKSYGFLLNGYVDSHNDTIFTPYVMAGIGFGTNKSKKDFTAKFDTKPCDDLIWNAGFGIQVRMSDSVSFGLSYRYVDLGKIKIIDQTPQPQITYKKKLRTNEAVAELAYNF